MASARVTKLKRRDEFKVLDGTPWTPADSAELYGIRNWGAGYFDLADDGTVTVNVPFDGKRVGVSLLDIIAGMQQRGLQMPVLLRIENILDAQISLLNESFGKAIRSLNYGGGYRGVFPIKVNQQCQVIEEIAHFGARYGHGLEAGSKAELLIALASLDAAGPGHIICNGYKDTEFVDLGLQALKLGYKCIFVIETPTELPIILESSRALGVRPMLGVRVKLSSRVSGAWNESSGDRSIFGLTTSQLVETLDLLREHEMLDCLQLLHYHLGSQIPNIREIRAGVLEACRYYVDLVKEGAPLGYLDLGGGLAVDYDGSQTNYDYSKNYSLDEYCLDVVETIMSALDPQGIPHPVIVTESGRATVAYSSVLLFNILDVTRFEPGELRQPGPGEHELIGNLRESLKSINPKNLQECYNDAVYYREEIRELFKRGQIRLRELSLAEDIFLEIVRGIVRELDQAKRVPAGLAGLEHALSDIYYGNFSVFQSLPDVWAIEQVFPIMPVHRHTEAPTRQAIIADITCDSDGKIDRFIGKRGVGKTLPVHPLVEGQTYYFGVFLVGAYQETLGDLHNLMGDTNVASVRINEDGTFDVMREMSGDSIADVLSYVEYQPQQLLEQFRKIAEQGVREGRISLAERQSMLEAFSESLRGYTYYED